MSTNWLITQEKLHEFEAIPFDRIHKEHFLPALTHHLVTARERIKRLRESGDIPTFENTILALECASEELDTVVEIYYNLMSSHSDDEFKNLAQEISPLLSEFSSEIALDSVIFDKVKEVYDKAESLGLKGEEFRLTEKTYKSFVRNGALLEESKKARLKELDKELSRLSPQFSQNLVGATNAFELLITEKEKLLGLPESVLEEAAHLAGQKGKEGWLFNLQVPSVQGILTYAQDRKLRKQISLAYGSRAFNDSFDNQKILLDTVALRKERADILGFATHADYVLTERMAGSPEKVVQFLERIYEAALPKAKAEHRELAEFARAEDGIDLLEDYDAAYYTEKLKKKLYDFDDEILRPYFKMEEVMKGIFKIAGRLYGIRFEKNLTLPVYHPDVSVYEVRDQDGEFLGLFYVDLFPRETKNGGAWMTTYRSQGLRGGKVERPHVSIVANLSPSTPNRPSLLKLYEVETIFHEFGHALHGLLSRCRYVSLGGTNVYWDFVELPSQIMENWAHEKEALDLFAYHYETGEKLSDNLIEKVKAAKKFQAGMFSLRQLGFGFLDLAWHYHGHEQNASVVETEEKVMQRIRLYPRVAEKNASCQFSHIFAGGYSAGYYSYKWAELLEADAFFYFRKKGIFNPDVAQSFRKNILERGNTMPPMELYKNFRGQEPDPQALLKKTGLMEEE